MMDLNSAGPDQKNKELMFTKEPYYFNFSRFVSTPRYYHPHWHDFMELLFVEKGYLSTTLRNTKLTINEKELLVVMPGELHSTNHDGDGILEYGIIHIESNFLRNAIFDSTEYSRIYSCFFNSKAPQLFHCSAEEIDSSGIYSVINNLFSEFEKKDQGYTLSIRADLLKIFVWLLRREDMHSQLESELNNFLICKRLHPVLELVNDQYQAKFSTKEMADKMNMSVYHFCHLFKKLTGRSFSKYLQSLRIVESVKLLLSTNDSIKQIAFQVGYDDVNYFVRVFKNETGMSPSKYRKEYIPGDNTML